MSGLRELPKGWKIASLCEIGEIISGGTPSTGIPEYWNGDINWISPADLSGYFDKIICKGRKSITRLGLAKSSARLMPKGSVLFSSRAPIGYVAIAGCEVCTNQGFKSVIPNEAIFNEYLYYFLKSAKKQAEDLASGTTFKEISSTNFSKIQIPFPPVPEQHRIVVKIEELFSSLDKGIENLKTAQQQLKVYRQAVLKWAFEGKLTNENVVDGELPEGWVRLSLKELVHKISDGPFGSHLKSSDYVENGVRVIRLENIGYMEFKNEFQSFVTKDKYNTIKNHTVTKGDIIFSSFIAENIRSAILPDFIDRAINKADCFLVRTDKNKVFNKYLFFYFSTREIYQQLVGEIHGATRPRINTTQLKSCQIPITTLPEQYAIVAEIESRLSVGDKIEEGIEHSLRQAESLRQSILKKAFEGKLVAQDPNDEPASVILERIRAERLNQKSLKNGVTKKG